MKRIISLLLVGMLVPGIHSFVCAQDITTGLVQYYPFINGTKDESGHSPDAIVHESHYSRDMHGYPEGSPCLVGNSYYIEFPDSVNLATPGWTYSIWFKLYALPSEQEEGDAFLLCYRNIAFGDDVHLYVDDADNAVKVFFENDGYKLSTGAVVQRGVWYHAVLRYTNTTTDAFVNGRFLASSGHRFTNVAGYVPLGVSTTIGYYPVNKGRVFGNVDDIRMYKRVLSDVDIKLLYDTEKNMLAPMVKKDTVYIRDTLIKKDTVILRETITIHDTIVKTVTNLDTVILGGNCIISPNPVSSSGRLYIQTSDRPITVVIYTAAGQLVRRKVLTTEDYIGIDNLPGGTYYIKVVSPTGTCGKRIVVN